MPGLTMNGLPTAPDGKPLRYHCNGYLCYYVCVAGFFFVHYLGILPASTLADKFGEYLVAAVIIADVTTVFWYFYGLYTTDPRNGKDFSSGYAVYDFFMGTVLYPRIGEVDIKMIAECRWSWLTLFLLTASCAAKQYEKEGRVSKEMGVMLLAHWLYSNATVKGEHYIPPTWDMFHERFGWMLNFWNIAGVPFLYCFQSFYILRHQKEISESLPHSFKINGVPVFSHFLFAFLCLAYYIFDTANCQKASIKMSPKDIRRNTFPQLPWAILENPRMLNGKLLIDGWYAFARKMQYTGDIMMALSWGMATGFQSLLPYFYVCFFTCMITHRQWRDEIRCREKYGELWDRYTKLVPNVFIPGTSFFVWHLTGKHPLENVKLD